MLDNPLIISLSRSRSRRRALQLLIVSAAATLVPLGNLAHAQSSSEPRPGAEPSPSPAGTGTNPQNRFAPALSPSPSATPDPTDATPEASPEPNGTPAQAAPAQRRTGSPTPTPAASDDVPSTTDDEPSTDATPADGQTGSQGWVQNHRPTDLWSGPDASAISFGLAPAFSYFQVLGAQESGRFRVKNPLTNGVAYVTAKDIGASGAPPEWYLSQKNQLSIPGRIIGGANIRSAPSVQEGNVVGHAGHNEGVGIIGEVKGSDGETWYRVGPNELVHASLVRVPASFPAHPGKLIVAELNDPCIVTAYEDGKPVYSTLALKGTAAWVTPTGFFTILRRVANEIMSSEGLGIARDAPGGYYLKDVLFTQYFTNDGSAIHYNYWSSNWGASGTHGCLGMNYDDSLWFWEWAEVGTPLVIQE
jgi:hypothetical protein